MNQMFWYFWCHCLDCSKDLWQTGWTKIGITISDILGDCSHFCFEQGSWWHHEPEVAISHTDKMGRIHGTYYALSIAFCVPVYLIIFPIPFLYIQNPYSKTQLTQEQYVLLLVVIFLVCHCPSVNNCPTLRKNILTKV